ncbi:hypothetical protein LTSESEN_2426 [Salmonella enterica subsp. enterica serovar Senftenberg str. A4-543]|uniref:Uncharacterized protein n=1 Tax=Salmonella enterica subsp. enterica serovar Senftenberg str. A4-543 TaxID=913082 RepID=G5QZQ4_SALSE|nr:hypothetical protein LTSESEN_2426 [Salmonella enterica subsp. enterica serovar Senftenberg str. A4-543]
MPDKRYIRNSPWPILDKRYRAPAIFYFVAGAASGSSI